MDKEKRKRLEQVFEKRRTDEKRERIASLALQALIGRREFPSLNDEGCVDFLTSLAVAYADELIEKLNKAERPVGLGTRT